MKSTYTNHAENEKWLSELNKNGTVLLYRAISAERGAMYERCGTFDSIFEFGNDYPDALANAREKWNADYQ